MGNFKLAGNTSLPIDKMNDILKEINSDYIFVDFHAEATSEKLAFAHYFDESAIRL